MDASGVLIGTAVYGLGDITAVLRKEGTTTVVLRAQLQSSFYHFRAPLVYFAIDCTGPALLPLPYETNIVGVGASVVGSTAYYAAIDGIDQITHSSLLEGHGWDQTSCENYIPGSASFVPPDRCCICEDRTGTFGAARTIDLGQFAQPFRFDLR